jgi:hypothetical protein
VVESLMQDRDLLPVRYGTQMADEAAAAQALAERHEQLAGALEFVRGAVELAVRVLGTAPPRTVERPANGREYLRGAAADAAATDAAREAVHGPLSSLARAHIERPGQRRGELLVAAYLVGRADVDRFAAEVAALDRRNPELTLTCTGPWPPYSFVER